MNVYDGMVRFVVPAFIMLSGALLLDLGRPFSIKRFYSRKLLRIVVALVVWSAAYAIVETHRNGDGVSDFFDRWIEGHYHLWFLYMMVGVYLSVPVCRAIVADKKLCRYFLIIWFTLMVALPYISTINRFIPLSNPYVEYIVDSMDLLKGKVSAYMFLGYPGYFILGYYLRHNRPSRLTCRAIYLLGAVGALATIICTALRSVWSGEGDEMFYARFSLNVFFMTVAVFTFFSERQHNSSYRGAEPPPARFRFMTLCSDHCFGIYLIHVFVLEWLQEAGFSVIAFNPVLSIPIIAACVFFASFAIAILLRKIPVVGRVIL
jgi:surface polysaccharide O-acyltransferase-like enzyme